MRIVSWNFCDAFNRKFGHLERLRPDIAVVQEVRPECLRYAALGDRSFWIGDPGQKGLAVISYGNWRLSPTPLSLAERWFLPLTATNGTEKVHLVAAWVESSKDCVLPTLRALEQLRDFTNAAPSIIAGDFNQSVTLDKKKGPGRRFADVLRVLHSAGMNSAWHGFHSELHGEETRPTLYWTWNAERKYHIDFIFGSSQLLVDEATLGTCEQYVQGKISDHVPLIVDYRLA